MKKKDLVRSPAAQMHLAAVALSEGCQVQREDPELQVPKQNSLTAIGSDQSSDYFWGWRQHGPGGPRARTAGLSEAFYILTWVWYARGCLCKNPSGCAFRVMRGVTCMLDLREEDGAKSLVVSHTGRLWRVPLNPDSLATTHLTPLLRIFRKGR